MKVSNIFESNSLCIKTLDRKRYDITQRTTEMACLEEVIGYCKQLGEPILKNDDIYYIEVVDGLQLHEVLYDGNKDLNIEHDIVNFLANMIDKDMSFADYQSGDEDEAIFISLGEYNNCAYDKRSYLAKRREILKCITDVKTYSLFMASCFPNCVFADDIELAMRGIEHFDIHCKEITDKLSILNDEALDLYNKHSSNLEEAMKILSAKLLECSPEKGTNSKYVKFTFSYLIDGENAPKTKEIECSPHLKLIRKNSDLRIYFYWQDKQVGNGEKVLVGRIGSHPY